MASVAGLSAAGGLAAQPGFTERLDICGIDISYGNTEGLSLSEALPPCDVPTVNDWKGW